MWYNASPWWLVWPQTSWQRGQYFPVLASNSSHCHPADRCSILTFFYLMLFVQVSVGMAPYYIIYGLSNKEDRECAHRLHHRLCSSAMTLDWLLSRNLKLILRAFSDFPRKLDPQKLPAIRYTYQCNNISNVHVPEHCNSYMYVLHMYTYYHSSNNHMYMTT